MSPFSKEFLSSFSFILRLLLGESCHLSSLFGLLSTFFFFVNFVMFLIVSIMPLFFRLLRSIVVFWYISCLIFENAAICIECVMLFLIVSIEPLFFRFLSSIVVFWYISCLIINN